MILARSPVYTFTDLVKYHIIPSIEPLVPVHKEPSYSNATTSVSWRGVIPDLAGGLQWNDLPSAFAAAAQRSQQAAAVLAG
jgi:hypothetical protein